MSAPRPVKVQGFPGVRASRGGSGRQGRRTQARCEAALGPEYGIAAAAQACPARAPAATGESEEAETPFVQAPAFQDRDKPGSLQTFETRYHLAAMLADQGR